jgi:hypothetical protein
MRFGSPVGFEPAKSQRDKHDLIMFAFNHSAMVINGIILCLIQRLLLNEENPLWDLNPRPSD